jgi:hypothetical protein
MMLEVQGGCGIRNIAEITLLQQPRNPGSSNQCYSVELVRYIARRITTWSSSLQCRHETEAHAGKIDYQHSPRVAAISPYVSQLSRAACLRLLILNLNSTTCIPAPRPLILPSCIFTLHSKASFSYFQTKEVETFDKMGGNTKYQPVASEDHDEATSAYTQPPPSYQAESSQGILGAPRSENDNVPDDFKVCFSPDH